MIDALCGGICGPQNLVYIRIKVFMWKLLHNILPCSVSLQARGVEADSLCKICGDFVDFDRSK